MTPPDTTPKPSELGKAVQDVTELSQKLIRDEIELAKAEISQKVTKLAKGAAVGAAAGTFAFFALIYLLQSLAWGLWKLVPGDDSTDYWLGFLLTAVILLLLSGLAGFLAYKFVKGGAPPTPKMAIEEAQKVKETVSR